MSSQRIKPKITLREKLVALSGALTLAFTAWGFGGVIAWSLHIMLAGGLLTFALAVVPLPVMCDPRCKIRDSGSSKPRIPHPASRIPKLLRGQKTEDRGQRPEDRGQTTHHSTTQPLTKLLKTPAFYFAAAFLFYLAIAALNPAWQIVSDQRGWWLEEITPSLGTWLPTSVMSSYEPMNAWRIFNMHLAALSLALGLYVGLSSRRAVQFVLWAFLVSVSLMAVVAIVQKHTQADAVLWTFKSENRHFWGSFFYRNQGTAFLNWGIVIAGVLYFYHARRCREEARSGGPHFLAFCLIGLIAISVGLALSRGGILFGGILAAVFLILCALDYFYVAFQHASLSIFLALSLIMAALFSAGTYFAYQVVDFEAIEKRFGNSEVIRAELTNSERILSSRATWEMVKESPWTGWGAGSFRYAFPMYQKNYDEIFTFRRDIRGRKIQKRKVYRYAHNDILQFFAEYGIVGCSLLLLSVFSILFSGFRFQLSSLWLAIGLACAACHAFLDFIFHSPSYWLALIGGIALVSRLLHLEARRGSFRDTRCGICDIGL